MSEATHLIEAPSFDNMREVQSILYREYMGRIESICNETFSEVRGEIDSGATELSDLRERFGDLLWESVDGLHWVIYTHKARLVLWVSDSPDACEEETGEKPETVEAQAFYAILADCQEWAERNLDLDSEEEEEEEEEEAT